MSVQPLQAKYLPMELIRWEMEGTEPSQRERDVLQLMAEGETIQSAAERLGICFDNAKSTLKLARARLGARHTTHAIAISLRRGYIT